MRGPKHTPNPYRIEGEVAFVALLGRDGQLRMESKIDTADLGLVSSSGRWLARWDRSTRGYYVDRSPSARFGREKMTLHRFLLEPPRDLVVDHINHDTLDNRRCNLRICTIAENGRNRRPKDGNSSPTGHERIVVPRVHWSNDHGRWRATIHALGHLHVGYYAEERDARIAAEAAATTANMILRRRSLTVEA
jgi:hypothetical protein